MLIGTFLHMSPRYGLRNHGDSRCDARERGREREIERERERKDER